MDILTFIAEMSKSCAWPVVFLISLLLFRNPILGVLQYITRIKYGDFEFEFKEQLSDVSGVAKTLQSEKVLTKEAETVKDRLLSYVATSPSLAIIEAWREV